MRSITITFLGFFIAITWVISGLSASAQIQNRPPATNPQEEGTFGTFEVGLPGIPKDQSIDDFVKDPKPILRFINLAVNAVIAVLVIIGLITIVIGGYIYMTASGDASRVKLAKEMIIAALAGIFLSLVSVIILNTINRYLGSDAQEPILGEPAAGSGGSGGGSGGGGNGGGGGGGNGGGLPNGGGGNRPLTLAELQAKKAEYEGTIAQMNESLRRPNNTEQQIKEYWETKLDRQAKLDAVNKAIADLNK